MRAAESSQCDRFVEGDREQCQILLPVRGSLVIANMFARQPAIRIHGCDSYTYLVANRLGQQAAVVRADGYLERAEWR